MKYSTVRTSLGRTAVFAAKPKAKRNQKLLVFKTDGEIPSVLSHSADLEVHGN